MDIGHLLTIWEVQVKQVTFQLGVYGITLAHIAGKTWLIQIFCGYPEIFVPGGTYFTGDPNLT